MNFFEGFLKAINNSFKGFSLIFEKGLWPYIFYPIILWLLMWGASIYLFASIAEQIAIYLNEKFNFSDIPESGSWLSFIKPFLSGYFSIIIAWILKILFWFVSSTFSKYMVLIFLSPLFTLLSESVEEKINGNKYPFNLHQFFKDIGRGIAMSIRNMLIEYFFIVLCFIVTLFFPPLVFITAPFLIMVSWYFLGFTMIDYNFERHKMSISKSVQFAKRNKGLICGIGSVYSFFMMLPLFFGLMFGPLLAVVGATISFLHLKEKETII